MAVDHAADRVHGTRDHYKLGGEGTRDSCVSRKQLQRRRVVFDAPPFDVSDASGGSLKEAKTLIVKCFVPAP